jgi:NAD(P)-dependent dehydrogenase (short-subunit alcohol dehydrogenase family)
VWLVAQRFGKIILTTSVVGLFGMRGQATYAAAKSAAVGLMRILALKGAEHGILVNAVSPSAYTRTYAHPMSARQLLERTCAVSCAIVQIGWF